MDCIYTPEQLAIRQWLSKPAPSCGACGCTGARPLNAETPHLLSIKAMKVEKIPADSMVRVARVMKNRLGYSFARTADTFVVGSEHDVSFLLYPAMLVINELNAAGAVVTPIWEQVPMEPACPCAMQWVERVQGDYYRIDEHRSTDGITHTATLLGPIGGPYLK